MAANDLDVLIVGARVAGSSLAILMGRQGRRVHLVDRDHFPSDTLSTHLLAPPAVAALAQLGVLAEVEASGLRRLVRTRSYVGECVLEGPMMPVPPGYGLAPRRDRLDWILIQHAISHSTVTFEERTRAVELLRDGERVVGAILQDARGQRREVHARAVVGADGKNSDVARWVEAPAYAEVPPLRPGYYGYYRNVAPLPDPTLELFFIDDHIGFIFPMEPGIDCLAMEITPEEFETFRKEPRQAFEARFREFPGMERRLRGATLDGRLMGIRGVENYFRIPFGPGWALTGDAAYCKDPSTGLGIGDAFTQAFYLADAIAAGIDGDWAKELADYHKARDAMLMPLYEATLSFTKAPPVPPESLDTLHAVLSSPGLARALAIGFAPTVQSSPAFTERGHTMITMFARAFAARRVHGHQG
ncbi:MAG TPA: NAD(P)/FAD-dependent oxidoreductase [Terriglobales bacterium]|nr:NAD(P)/FAD-dependent oxidoreductase [Terriglobales bacterium]